MAHRTHPRSDPVPPAPAPSRYARRRAACLGLVYVLMTIHVLHWKLAGKTLAPLEFNEVMYTAELGIVTAGFLFMLGAVVATAIFGRFFCSWGCHILALQDLCAWVLGKLHIRPKAVRSRLLLWVPITVAAYMFVWPQVQRLWIDQARPTLRTATDTEGWASFETTNFWRNLPGPGITILTFLVCGFAIVYVLGSRSFCTYGCPYGAIFSLTDRIAPGRIRMKDAGTCTACGTCTAVCTSHVRVHEELNRYGTVVNPSCLKDLDCVSACPKGNVYYGFGVPSLVTTPIADTPVRKVYDFTLAEELVAISAFLVVVFVYRGLYDLIPFFLSIGLGAIAGFGAVLSVRLIRRDSLQWSRLSLKRNGRLLPSGWFFSSIATMFMASTLHSGVVHYHSYFGRQDAMVALSTPRTSASDYATPIVHLTRATQWGLVSLGYDRSLLAELHFQSAAVAFRTDDRASAKAHLLKSVQLRPDRAVARFELGALLISLGETPAGIHHLEQAAALKPDYADAHYNLAVAYWMTERSREALQAVNRALSLNPNDVRTNDLRSAIMQTQESQSNSP